MRDLFLKLWLFLNYLPLPEMLGEGLEINVETNVTRLSLLVCI